MRVGAGGGGPSVSKRGTRPRRGFLPGHEVRHPPAVRDVLGVRPGGVRLVPADVPQVPRHAFQEGDESRGVPPQGCGQLPGVDRLLRLPALRGEVALAELPPPDALPEAEDVVGAPPPLLQPGAVDGDVPLRRAPPFWNPAVTSSFRSRSHASERRPWARWIVDFLGAFPRARRRRSSGRAARWAAMPRESRPRGCWRRGAAAD